jgi:polyhydroxyalkanoate synthesis regulator phasin
MLLPLDILRQVDDEIQHRIETLIKQGEVTEDEGMHWLDRLLSVSPRHISDVAIEREIKKIIVEQAIPTREEFQLVMGQVDALLKKLDELS